MKAFKCTIMRGGTSKGLFFRKEDVPQNENVLKSFLLDVMGSPDGRQIDGLGGANSLTSKVAIVSKSDREGVDVDYTFAQVSILDKTVDMKGNCGNISSAVGPFAVDEGLVSRTDGPCSVTIFNTNTGKIIESKFKVQAGKAIVDGDLEIPGVPGKGAPIYLTFEDPIGAVTGELLPTGNVVNTIETTFGSLDISIVDAANPLVFMNAEDLGIPVSCMPKEFDDEMLRKIEEVRSIACEMCGFAKKEDATKRSPAIPKATLIGRASSYRDLKDRHYEENGYDLSIRMMSMQRPHQALAITGAVCTTVASKVEGSLVFKTVKDTGTVLKLGHPGGVMETEYSEDEVKKVTVLRTARVLMSGTVYAKESYKMN